jgi:N-sulfoglucosamine sulfohydrolase
MKPNTLLNLAVILLAPLAVSDAAEAPKTAARPNIVFFFADDWGRDASCYASAAAPSISDVVKTPNIDRIAREGVRFTHAFYDSPQCTPSRAAIVSGCYFWRCGSDAFLAGGDWRGHQNPFKELPRFPNLLADSGYATAKAFKTLSFIPTLKSASVEGIKTYLRYGLYVSDGKTPADQEGRRQDVITQTRDSIRRVLADCPKGTPFFFVFGPINTHRPYAPGSGQALWNINPDALKGKVPGYLPDVAEIRTDLADYLGEVQALDIMVGIFNDELEKAGLSDNTILALAGDNGAPGFTHGKTQLYDLGSAAPLIIRWPARVRGGRTLDDFVSLKDLAPTFLQAAGVAAPAIMDARSLLPLLTSEKGGSIDPTRDAAIFGRERHYITSRPGNLPYPSRAIRTRDFLYIRNFKPDRWPFGDPFGISANLQQTAKISEDYDLMATAPFRDMDASLTKSWLIAHSNEEAGGKFYQLAFAKRPAEELYDLRGDPQQLTNVAGVSAYQPVRENLSARLMKVLKETHDPRLEDSFDHPPYIESPIPAPSD